VKAPDGCRFGASENVSHAGVQSIVGKIQTPRSRVLSGSVILLSGLGCASLANFAYNISVARALGPVAFGHTTVVYTLLILVSAATLSFQILTAKMVAQQTALDSQALIYRSLHLRAWSAGLLVSFLLLLFRNSIAHYLNLPDVALIILLAIGTAFYVPLGTRRGYIQGTCNFPSLAFNLVLEGLMRLGGSLALLRLGFGARGVIAANAAAVACAYFLVRPKLTPVDESQPEVPIAFRESLQAAVFFTGQVLINNCDIVVAKHFFAPDQAGIYAAIAMVGRVVFVFSWAVANSMFPIAAETRSRKTDDQGLLGTSLLMVSGICLGFAVVLRLAPGKVWAHLFGAHFEGAGAANFRYLLVLYAVCAGIYALSALLISYEMSHKIANTGWVQLFVGCAVIAGIYRYHSSLAQVIWVEMVMMLVLLLLVTAPFLTPLLTGEASSEKSRGTGLATVDVVTVRRRVSEDEVILEFLKNDIGSSRFTQYQDSVEKYIARPNLQDTAENEIRRALFVVRHGKLWNELPDDAEWFEASLDPGDLDRIRVFPRAEWRKVALGDFSLTVVSQRIAEDWYHRRSSEAFRQKIGKLRRRLERRELAGAILLIGKSETGPFTILDGNHRLVAAVLNSPMSISEFRFFCALSPKMDQCCWYRTNAATLARYARNLIRYEVQDPEKQLMRLLEQSEGADAQAL
jgi:O-antigen/teichoic acid export membrane protein